MIRLLLSVEVQGLMIMAYAMAELQLQVPWNEFLCTWLLKKMRPGLWEVLYTQELQRKLTVLLSGSVRLKDSRRNSKGWSLCTMMAPATPKSSATWKGKSNSWSFSTFDQFAIFTAGLCKPFPVSARTEKDFPGRHYYLLCSRFCEDDPDPSPIPGGQLSRYS